MTPAVQAARKARLEFTLHRYAHDPRSESFGLEAAEALGLAPDRVFKTLMVDLDGRGLAVAVVPVALRLDLKALAVAAGVKKAAMAEVRAAERATGYVVGGISPLGQRRAHPTFLDRRACAQPSIFVSAGRRGLEIELAATDLLRITAGVAAAIAR